jgi:hypothetical protein
MTEHRIGPKIRTSLARVARSAANCMEAYDIPGNLRLALFLPIAANARIMVSM